LGFLFACPSKEWLKGASQGEGSEIRSLPWKGKKKKGPRTTPEKKKKLLTSAAGRTQRVKGRPERKYKKKRHPGGRKKIRCTTSMRGLQTETKINSLPVQWKGKTAATIESD